MIENFLIASGLGCGTKNNFKDEVLKSMQLHLDSKWYFRTPVKVSGNGLKSAVLDMAFPFLALINDTKDEEGTVLSRLELTRKDYEDDLIRFLRVKKFIVPPDTANFYLIPFWYGEPGYRDELEDFNGIRLHILNAVVTVKYRNLELTTSIDPILFALQNEQSTLESKIDILTIYVAGSDFAELSQTDQDLLTEQLAAMNTYNDRLKTRITNY
jgi:hypothetical protein